MQNDLSKEIFEKYFDIPGRTLELRLKSGDLLRGMLVGYFHGDATEGEPYIVRWRFVSSENLARYREIVSVEGNPELTTIVWQKDIEDVQFV